MPDAAHDVVSAWQALDHPAQASLRRGWPTLALALDRLQAETVGTLLTGREVQAISDRHRGSPWDAPPAYYISESESWRRT